MAHVKQTARTMSKGEVAWHGMEAPLHNTFEYGKSHALELYSDRGVCLLRVWIRDISEVQTS